MERSEVMVYLSVGAVIVALVLALYFFNLQLTGFAVVGQSDLAQGVYENTLHNGSAVLLNSSANATSGSFLQILDAGNNSLWDNMTWEGAVLDSGNSSIGFQVAACSDASCSNASLSGVLSENNIINLTSLNLTSRYFEYKVLFSINNSNITSPYLTSLSYSYSPVSSESGNASQNQTVEIINSSVSVLEPSGEKLSSENIPVEYNPAGTEITCWYEVRDSNDTTIRTTTLSGCGNSSFHLTTAGDYNLTIFVNGSGGAANDSVDFSVSVPVTKTNTTTNTSASTTTTTTTNQEAAQAQTTVVALTLQNIETSMLNPSSSSNFNLVVSNSGNAPVSACKLVAAGDQASWVSVPDDSKNFNAGEQKSFAFSVSVPENTSEANYTLPLTVNCAETSKGSEFVVDVVKKKIEFNITDVSKALLSSSVRISYSIKELLGKDQSIDLKFWLYDVNSSEIGNVSLVQNISANSSRTYRVYIPINGSLSNDNLTVSANYNTESYSSSVREPIVLGSPTGLSIIEDVGTTGSVAIAAGIIVVVVGIFFVIRRKRLSRKEKTQ